MFRFVLIQKNKKYIPEDSPAMKAAPKHDTSVLLLFFILTTVVDVTLAINHLITSDSGNTNNKLSVENSFPCFNFISRNIPVPIVTLAVYFEKEPVPYILLIIKKYQLIIGWFNDYTERLTHRACNCNIGDFASYIYSTCDPEILKHKIRHPRHGEQVKQSSSASTRYVSHMLLIYSTP
ncbi:hypothetical protein AGLY_009548 [Aphis glycines]|uniref:Uncharacterized protein n=1 Tax=Aphis glycines TaxID=307491 RepID=A0A6G0TK02_APHGL|nr:hypothetical protein AGLY_009548 [Aphis glycines]